MSSYPYDKYCPIRITPNNSNKNELVIKYTPEKFPNGLSIELCFTPSLDLRNPNPFYKHFEHKYWTKIDARSYQCLICSKSYKTPSLHSHINNHLNIRPFKCDYCEERYADKKHLATHVSAYHLMKFCYRCRGCTSKFQSKARAVTHVQQKHRGVLNLIVPLTPAQRSQPVHRRVERLKKEKNTNILQDAHVSSNSVLPEGMYSPPASNRSQVSVVDIGQLKEAPPSSAGTSSAETPSPVAWYTFDLQGQTLTQKLL